MEFTVCHLWLEELKMYFKIILVLLFSSQALANTTYQEEFVFLTQQLKSLKNRKFETLKQLNAMQKTLEKEVFDLEKEVARLSGETQVLETKLRVYDQERLDQDIIVSTLKSLEGQMIQSASLKGGQSVESFDKANDFLFSHLENGIKALSKKGEAIDLSGKTIDGDLIQLGHVVTYFKNNKGGYNLTSRSKINDDSLYVYDQSLTKGELENIGKNLSIVPLTFEDGKRVESKTYTEVAAQKLKEGGLVGYVILLLGLLGLALAVLRWSYIRPFENADAKSLEQVIFHIQQGDTNKAKKLLSEVKPHPMSEFIEFILSNLKESSEVYESKVMNRLFTAKKRLNRFGPYLLVLAGVAPLLGLLGTVTGMIETFSMITVYGTGDPKVLSGGIKAALVTTQLGLIVAIPCILIGNYLSSKASKVMNQFEQFASSIPKE
jgi:biopolymer transport protein ExbB